MRLEMHLKKGKKPDTKQEVRFDSLFRKYEQPLLRFAYKITKSTHQSSDIVQEVFIKLWEHRDEVDSIQNMEAWLHKVAKNKLIDSVRKLAADDRLRESLWKKMEAFNQETEQTVDAKECQSIINEAVNQLPPQRRLVFHLNRHEGLNYQQIAKELAISKHTVKNQMSMALHSIHRFLKGSALLLLANLLIK